MLDRVSQDQGSLGTLRVCMYVCIYTYARRIEWKSNRKMPRKLGLCMGFIVR